MALEWRFKAGGICKWSKVDQHDCWIYSTTILGTLMWIIDQAGQTASEATGYFRLVLANSNLSAISELDNKHRRRVIHLFPLAHPFSHCQSLSVLWHGSLHLSHLLHLHSQLYTTTLYFLSQSHLVILYSNPRLLDYNPLLLFFNQLFLQLLLHLFLIFSSLII